MACACACADDSRAAGTSVVDSTSGVDSTGGADGGSKTLLSSDEFVELFFPAICARATACCSTDQLDGLFPFGEIIDQEGCEFFWVTVQDILGPLIDFAVKTDRAEWRGEAAAACIARLKTMTCEEYAAELTPSGGGYIDCRPMKAKVANGGACAMEWECVSGLCSGAVLGTDGVCAAMPVAGEPCPDALCADGAQCDIAGETPACVALKADGEACLGDSECLSNGCSEGLNQAGLCGEPTVCDGDPSDDNEA